MLKPLPCVGSPGLWRRCPHRRAAQRPHCIPVSRPQRPPALAACSRLTGPLKEVIHHCCHGPGSSCVVAAHLEGSRAARGLPLRGFRQPGRGSAEPRAGRGRAGCLGHPAPAPILTRDGHRLRPFATTVRVHRTPEPLHQRDGSTRRPRQTNRESPRRARRGWVYPAAGGRLPRSWQALPHRCRRLVRFLSSPRSQRSHRRAVGANSSPCPSGTPPPRRTRTGVTGCPTLETRARAMP
jgi:hypothetical protein